MRYGKLASLAGAIAAGTLCLCACTNGAETTQTDSSSYYFTMGTVFTIRVIDTEKDPETVITEIESVINNCDSEISWRTEGSLTDQFNQNKTADMSDIDQVISDSLEVAEKSNGAYDITVLPLTQLWNFDKMADEDFDPDSMTVPDQNDIDEALGLVDYTKLDYDNGILTTSDDRQTIELGAIGKGYALSEALKVIEDEDVTGAMISAGSSILLCGTKEDGSEYTVALRDPRGEEDDYIGIFTMTDCTVTTSGDYERYFEVDGKRYHHILDPRTGYPADSGLIQVTIINDDSAMGDALSTACFILGLDDGMKLADEYGCTAVFVDSDKNVWYNDPSVLDILDFTGDSAGYTLKEYNQM